MTTVDDWKNETTAGFEAMAGGHYVEAARCWSTALNLAIEVGPDDPRRAAALSNAGVGLILAGQDTAAIEALDQSAHAWRHVASRVETIDVPATGTSSAFHFRLASRHLIAFQNARRSRLSELCAASLAITQFNRACAASSRSAEFAQAAEALADILSNSLGAHAPEIRMLKPPSEPDAGDTPNGNAPYADKFEALKTRPSPRTGFVGTLETACALTALIAPFTIARRDQETDL